MVVVGLDTATDDTAVCAIREGEVLYEASVAPEPGERPRHATALLPGLERAAASAGGWGEVGRLAVGVGPGSFTGLRIGVSTARALAGSLSLSLAAVSSLDALARGLGDTGGLPRLAAIDARRGEVFAALYDSAGERVWDPFATTPADLVGRVAELPEAPVAAGSGTLRFRPELAAGRMDLLPGSDPRHRVAAREICAIGAAAKGVEPEAVEPIYLRQPDAERWRDRDT
jgi:tRNA threonylcarbamoyladenosine biosynthesis protein TsaB